MFWGFATLMGLSLSTIFLVYTGDIDRGDLLRHRGAFAGLSLVRLHHQEGPVGLRHAS